MSTEDQKHSEDPNADNARAGSLPRNFGANEEQPQTSTTNPANENPNYYERLKEFYKNPRTWLETLGLVILTFYTTFAGVQSCTMNSTLTEIKQQTTIAEAGNRPWLKIMDVTIDTAAPEIPVLSFYAFQNAGRTINTVNPRFEFRVKNIGKGVAHDVYIGPSIIFSKEPDLGKTQIQACRYVATNFAGGVKPPFAWSAVFPDDEVSFRVTVGALYQPTDVQRFPPKEQRAGDWLSGTLIGCVIYQYPKDYETSAVFYLMGEKDRFVEIGKDLKASQMHLIRDNHYDRAQ